jgi:hypothetical protein
MAHMAYFVCLANTVSGCCRNALGRGSNSGMRKIKPDQCTFPRYLCICMVPTAVATVVAFEMVVPVVIVLFDAVAAKKTNVVAAVLAIVPAVIVSVTVTNTVTAALGTLVTDAVVAIVQQY